jgi:hypothetical protein
VKYYIAECDVGDDIFDILNDAAFVLINDAWCPVLGYDETDDVLCAENYKEGQDDFIQRHASKMFTHTDFKIAVEITEK